MQTSQTFASTATASTWNGGFCQTCGARYLGSHACTNEDILRRVTELLGMLNRPTVARGCDPTSACPCRPENGGGGVCGCVLSGPRVTC
jgi:hypothetical protein